MTKNLYILDEVNSDEVLKFELDNCKIVVFDYASHRQLTKNNIAHTLIDDFLSDNERQEIFKFCSKYLVELEEYTNKQTTYHGINLINIIDRNELLESLMYIVPQAYALKKIIEKENYDYIYTSSRLYEIFHKTDLTKKFVKLKESSKSELTFEKITIPINFSKINFNFTLSREKYQKMKNILEKISISLFSFSNYNPDIKKIVLIELDPEVYQELLREIKQQDMQAILVNFRKSTVYSKKALDILRETNSLVFTSEQIIEKDVLREMNVEKKQIINYLKNNSLKKELIPELKFNEIELTYFLEQKINDILIQRNDEYLNSILIAEKLSQDKNNVGVLMLNNSGETEKIFSRKFEDSSIYLLQHAFANYLESISYFDLLDDFHRIRENIVVWGNLVRDYLINIRKFSDEQILVVGSPKYDSFSKLEKSNKKYNRILVTLRPVISHMEGLRIEVYNRYEETLKRLVKFSDEHPDIEMILKLHPQQNLNNEIIKNMINGKKQIKVLQSGGVKELLAECDIVINIATDNFDVSSVILEAMLLDKPVMNIALQKNIKEFEIFKEEIVENIFYDTDIEKEIFAFFDKTINKKLKKDFKKFLTEYLANYGFASTKLIDNIKKN